MSMPSSNEAVATITQGEGGRLRLRYDDAWRDRPEAYPLSLSMPLSRSDHKHGTIKSFLWNLLFEQHQARESLAQRFGVSPANPFAMIGCIGEDLAGSLQLVPPEKLDTLARREGVSPISRQRLARHLETAFLEMVTRVRAKEQPDALTVTDTTP